MSKGRNHNPWEVLWTEDSAHYGEREIDPHTDGVSHLLLHALEGSRPGESILEVGSGPATRSIPISEQLGLDLSVMDSLSSAHHLAIERAGRHGIKIKPCVGDAVVLPFKTESFQYVLSYGLNEHFAGDQRQQLFSEMHRVTAPGGSDCDRPE